MDATRSTIVSLSLIATMLACVAPASADEASSAQFHYAEASRHYAARRYRDAIREFFLVRARAENPRIDYNLALCFDQLRRRCRGDRPECAREARQAFHWYSSYLASDDSDATRRSTAETRVSELRAEVAMVEVRSEPEGAAIYIDRQEIGSYGAAPRTIALTPGNHRLTLRLGGHRDASVEIEAVRGQTVAASATLERIFGTLRVLSPVEGHATVRDTAGNTVAEGPTRLEASIAPGTYRVEVVADGHRAWDAEAVVTGETERVIEANPVPLPAPTADLTVTANVTGAVVHLDGEPAGFTPAVLSGLSPGPHDLRLEHAGMQPVSRRFELVAEERGWLTAALEPPPENVRSEATWLVGGLGLASLAGGAATGTWALVSRQELDDAIAERSGRNLTEMADLGAGLAISADVLFSVAAVALALATLLYFVTEHREDRRSRTVFSRGER